MRPEKQTGTEQYAKFVIRILRSYGRKAEEGELDTTALEQLADVQAMLDDQVAATVLALRAEGYSWDAIGASLGMTRSAAYKKFIGRTDRQDAPTARRAGGQPGSLR